MKLGKLTHHNHASNSSSRLFKLKDLTTRMLWSDHISKSSKERNIPLELAMRNTVFSPPKHKIFRKYEKEIKERKITNSPDRNGADLFSNIKCLLVVGKLIFLIPCEGFNWESHDDFIFRKNSFWSVIACLMIGWCIVKDIVGLKFLFQIGHGGVVGYVHPAHYVLISSILTFIYVYFFINLPTLKKLFVSWNRISSTFGLKVFALKRVTWYAVLPMLLPCIINTMFSLDAIYHFNGQVVQIPPNMTKIEYAYVKLMRQWDAIVPFTHTFAVFCTFDFIWGSFPRSFVISSVIVFSYAISRQFKDLVEKTKAGSRGLLPDQDFWLHVVKKHNALTQLVSEFDAFLSPLIFITYLTSLYLICMQLLRALSSSTGGGVVAELTLGLSTFIYNGSFCVEVFLLYFMSISAAQINDYAHQIGNVLRECPMEFHISEVARLENRVNFGPRIGFTGLGCFVITKPFLLTIANAFITLEIVLLQAQFTQPVTGMR